MAIKSKGTMTETKYKKLGSYWQFAFFIGFGIGEQEIQINNEPKVQIIIVMLPFCSYVEIIEINP